MIEEVDARSDEQRAKDRAQIETSIGNILSAANLDRPAEAGLYQAALDYRLLHA